MTASNIHYLFLKVSYVVTEKPILGTENMLKASDSVKSSFYLASIQELFELGFDLPFLFLLT